MHYDISRSTKTMGMVVTEADLAWAEVHQPLMRFFPSFYMAEGTFMLNARYRGKCTLSDEYKLRIEWRPYAFRLDEIVPRVFEIGGKIHRMAKVCNKSIADFHVNGDGTLCLIRYDHIPEWYPPVFSFKYFVALLTRHLYWVTYYYRFGSEPWKAEAHGWPHID